MTPTRKAVLGAALGALAIATGAQITLPMVPVPMTLQTLAVLCAGLILGPRTGACAAGLYMLLVLVGLPVLADGERAAGLAFLDLKSAGYVLGFVPGAWVAGRIGDRGGWKRWLGAGVAGHGVVLACGVPVLATWLGPAKALEFGLYPFLPGALVKSALAAISAWAMSTSGHSQGPVDS